MINNISILKNITILYAEDEKDLREVTHQILKGFTKKQYVAQNGQEGLELFKEHENEIDLIITDVNMPNMDGLTLIGELRKIPQYLKTPILVLTTERSDEMKAKGKFAGATGWIVKPFVPDQLLKAVNIVLSR